MIKIFSIASSKIRTSPFTYYKCIQCKAFGSNLKCPPYSPIWRETNDIIKDYNTFTIICSTYSLRESEILSAFNKYGSMERVLVLLVRKYSVITKWEAHKKMLELHKKITGKKVGFSCGRCLYCIKKGCNKQKCTKPDISFASLESAGIDIIRTLEDSPDPLDISFNFMVKRRVNAYAGILHNDNFLIKA